MTKEQVQYFRNKYKDQPVLIICDNEHNFFDNYPSYTLPIWDDDRELVTFMHTNQETSGMASSDFPYVVSVTSYDFIQSFRVFTDREKINDYLSDLKAKRGAGAYEYSKKIVNALALNSRPKREPYYK